MNATKLFLVLLAISSSLASSSAQPRPKILCLHGGGMGASATRQQLSSLMDELPDFEFVFATGAYGNPPNDALWMPDPTGGKGQPSTDPAIAEQSVAALNQIVATQGPFYGILGYSQGAAFVTSYLAQVPVGTFSIAVMFCGYLPETHSGLISTINAEAPFGGIPALIWMGTGDLTIPNSMTRAVASKYTSPMVISDNLGHVVPTSSAATFGRVVAFIEAHRATTPGAISPVASTPSLPVVSPPALPPAPSATEKPVTTSTSKPASPVASPSSSPATDEEPATTSTSESSCSGNNGETKCLSAGCVWYHGYGCFQSKDGTGEKHGHDSGKQAAAGTSESSHMEGGGDDKDYSGKGGYTSEKEAASDSGKNGGGGKDRHYPSTDGGSSAKDDSGKKNSDSSGKETEAVKSPVFEKPATTGASESRCSGKKGEAACISAGCVWFAEYGCSQSKDGSGEKHGYEKPTPGTPESSSKDGGTGGKDKDDSDGKGPASSDTGKETNSKKPRLRARHDSGKKGSGRKNGHGYGW